MQYFLHIIYKWAGPSHVIPWYEYFLQDWDIMGSLWWVPHSQAGPLSDLDVKTQWWRSLCACDKLL